jgi:translation initiation factor 2D
MLLNRYFTSKELINKRDQGYINLNPPLLTCVASKPPGDVAKKVAKGGKSSATAEQQAVEEKVPLEFMKRDELMKRVVERMQGWYEVKAEGKDVVTR